MFRSNIALRVIAFVGAFCPHTFGQATMQVSFKDLAEYGAKLISSADSGFAPAASFFSSAATGSVGLRPYAFILTNASSSRAVAYGLQWTYFTATGKPSSLYTRFVQINEFLDGGEAHAIAPPSAYSIAPKQMRLVAPIFNLPSLSAALTSVESLQAQDFLLRRRNDTAVMLTLDAIVFEDGTCAGPDAGGLCTRIETMLAARQDLFQRAIKATDESALTALLSSALSGSGVPQNIYQFFQADAAQPVAAMNKARGAQAARHLAQQLMYAHIPSIVRH